MRKRLNIVADVIIWFLLISLLGLILWGIITTHPTIDHKAIKEAIETAGKTFEK